MFKLLTLILENEKESLIIEKNLKIAFLNLVMISSCNNRYLPVTIGYLGNIYPDTG